MRCTVSRPHHLTQHVPMQQYARKESKYLLQKIKLRCQLNRMYQSDETAWCSKLQARLSVCKRAGSIVQDIDGQVRPITPARDK